MPMPNIMPVPQIHMPGIINPELTAIGFTSIIAAASTITFMISLNKYEKSTTVTEVKKDSVVTEEITRDPKWKRIGLISKLIAIVSFIITFILIWNYASHP